MLQVRKKKMAAWVLEDFKKKSQQSAIDVITAAVKIIKSDIREIPVDKSAYPSLEDMSQTDYEKNGYLRAYNISWTSFSFKAETVKFRTVHRPSLEAQVNDIASNFSTGSKLEIHLIWKMATYILYQKVLS